MDKFVVRTPRQASFSNERRHEKKRLKQATIECLRGVVIIEDILKFRSLLQTPDQSRDVILDCLRNLDKKIPARDILKKTKIGHTVRKLMKHHDRDVAELSQQIVDKWLAHYEAKIKQPLLDVKCDNETSRIRAAGRSHLKKTLELSAMSEDIEGISESIEREVFHHHKQLVHNHYRRMLRKLVFSLREQESLRRQILQQQITVSELVANCKS